MHIDQQIWGQLHAYKKNKKLQKRLIFIPLFECETESVFKMFIISHSKGNFLHTRH